MIKTIIIAIFTISFAKGQSLQEVENAIYNAMENGIHDISYEVRLDGLKEKLIKQFPIQIADEVYFKVYSLRGSREEIYVFGMPKGFERLKGELKHLIKNRIDLLSPKKFSSILKGYKTSSKEIEGGLRYEGVDQTNQLPVQKIWIDIDSNKMIKSIKTFSPVGTQSAKFLMESSPLSNGKWFVKSISNENYIGIQKISSQSSIKYTTVDKKLLPSEIEMRTVQEVIHPRSKKGEKAKQETFASIKFSNYIVNKKSAEDFFKVNPN